MDEENALNKVEVYCFRGYGYFGFGLTPKAAVLAARNAGMPAKYEPKGSLMRLPEGTTKYAIDSDGILHWSCPSNPTARPVHYNYDKATKTWKGPDVSAVEGERICGNPACPHYVADLRDRQHRCAECTQ